MTKDSQSYKLLPRGPKGEEQNERRSGDIDVADQQIPQIQAPAADGKPKSEQYMLPRPTSKFLDTKAMIEEPNVPLEKNLKPFLRSLIVHILPVASTIAIVQLTFRDVFWFDNDPDSDAVHWNGPKISLNELLNLLQFAAKIHEILLVGSLGAMVMHRVRNRLIGKRGLPFGMVTAGYSVGSAEYLISPAFWSGFQRKFMTLSVLILSYTVLANTFGPASAIALVPSLDWWPMKRPYGQEAMPVVFGFDNNYWWPAEITKNDTIMDPNKLSIYPPELCFSTQSVDSSGCPAGGFNEIALWVEANSYGTAQASITMKDSFSTTQRVVTSRLTESANGKSGVAITTSASQAVVGMMGTFWDQISAAKLPVENAVRPKLEIPVRETRQPLVQVQCTAYMLDAIKKVKTRKSEAPHNININTFSTTNASAIPVPDWVYDYEYKYPKKVFLDPLGRPSINKTQTTSLTWLEPPQKSNLSAVAMVIVPYATYSNSGNGTVGTQNALVHFCSIDARWVGSKHTYDPTQDVNIAHNITDPLIFQRPKTGGTERKYKEDISKMGISPALKLSTEWTQAMNADTEISDTTAPAFSWLLTPYIRLERAGVSNFTYQYLNAIGDQAVFFTFIPGGSNLVYSPTGTVNHTTFHVHVSNTLATILSIQITDALARLRSFSIKNGTIIAKTLNDTHSISSPLTAFNAFGEPNSSTFTENVTTASLDPYQNRWTFSIERYGYGYGFRTATVYFGVIVLLAHIGLVIIYSIYAFYDFFYMTKWTSSAWGGIAEFAALLINSNSTVELQNTCAGVDARETWRKTVWIREIEDGHLGLVVGEKEGLVWRHARRGVPYGRLGEGRAVGGQGVTRRRGSV
ncbi:hypothetical protein B0J11DRAFT_619970 [Dendryphion nanum]|uniref:Uncharacterized protein n=1 Tax=Dendryphion nanum TaxID=256645 RepID=A0A9P9D1S6_9PLEO|nr:hypothetical protein B0J11DRAFT_619970 [Dendryphion nanum]